jgi:hypothetical protein
VGKKVPTKIDRFLGLNESEDETNLVLGEASVCTNWRITDNYKLKKIEGYDQLFSSLGAYSINGMWYGKISGTYHFLFACNGVMYSKRSISSTIYDSVDNASYTNVSVVKTTAFAPATAGTTGVDGFTIVNNSAGTTLAEVAQANIDNVASIGKYYYHTDKTVWFITAKNAYATIALARTGLGTSTAYYRIGTLTAGTTSFIGFGTAVYILNGAEYYKYDGISAMATVAGYVPLIYTATPPAGGGTANEQINLLTGKKHQTFSGDGSATVYQLAETAINSVDSVYVGGALKTVTTHYTVDTTAGTVTFTVGNVPATGVDNVDIYWTKGSGSRSEIYTNYYFETFGGKNDTRVFVYGDGSNRYYYTGLASGVPSAEYWPALNYRDIGSSEYKITSLIKQYDRLLIYKENEAWWSNYEPLEDGAGNLIPDFPTYPLNGVKGNVALGQARLILNNPYSIMEGVYNWVASNVRDERNASYISLRVQPSLDAVDLTTALTYDWEAKSEYWLAVGNTVCVHNYKVDCWYKFLLDDTPTCFTVIDGEMYFGNTAGEIMKFDDDLRSFDGDDIDADCEMGFYDVEVEYLRKYLSKTWISLLPGTKESVDVSWITNKDGSASSTSVTIRYNNSTFSAMNFDDHSFNTNYNPQPFRIKTKAKKWVYFKLILQNHSDDFSATVLSINLLPRIGGESK